MDYENTIKHEDAHGRNAIVTDGQHEGREGRIVGFHIDFGVVLIRDKDTFEIFSVHETEMAVYA